MKTAAIIAEFDPFHNGHRHLINEVRRAGYTHIAAIISGSFVQRGDIAQFSKFDRARAALACGVDLVAENPLPWAMSTANNFALGGVSIARTLCCDAVAFGSECGDIALLTRTAAALESDRIAPALKARLKSGVTFAAAREGALAEIGADCTAVTRPNDTLAVEYISAAKRISYNPEFIAVKRAGTGHNGGKADGKIASSSAIRELIAKGDLKKALQFVPIESRGIWEESVAAGRYADIATLQTAILAKLRVMPPERFRGLPDISEGLEKRIYNRSRTAATLDELYFSVKTKRYTLARIRRTVLSAFLDIDGGLFGTQPPYTRILAANGAGKEILKNSRERRNTRIIIRTSELRGDPVFALECAATDLFALACRKPTPCGSDFTYGLIDGGFPQKC